MQNDIKDIIEDIYLKCNKKLFIDGCKKEFDFLNELIDLIKKESLNINVYSDKNEPSVEIRITVNKVDVKSISIEYITILKINKIVNYFYLQNEFELENPDPDGIDTHLDSFREEAYSKNQFILCESLVKFLSEKGYNRLSYNDMEEVCPQIRKFNDSDDDYMTVNNALFMDMWELCETDYSINFKKC